MGRTVVRAEDAYAARLVAACPLFDQAWYSAQRGLEFRSRGLAAYDYVRRGAGRGLSPHPLFDPTWYGRGASGRRSSPSRELLVYLNRRDAQKRSTHPLFDVQFYLRQAPEAATHRGGPVLHYLQEGAARGLQPSAAFDPRVSGCSLDEWTRRTLGDLQTFRRRTRRPRMSTEFDTARQQRLLDQLAGRTPAHEDGRPLVSVVMPVWNRADQVAAPVRSVLSQTLGDWELVVVDDGSEDDLPAALAPYLRDERITLVRVPHGGVSAARNEGLRRARGRFVAWLDSDNMWDPDFLRVMVCELQNRRLRAGYSALRFVGDDGTTRYRDFDGGLEHLRVSNHIDLNVLVAERDLVVSVGGFDTTLRRCVDYALVLRLAEATTIGYVPFVGADYDARGDQVRISTAVPFAWCVAVKNAHLVDWSALGRDLPGRRADVVSLVVRAAGSTDALRRTLGALVAEASPSDLAALEVVLVLEQPTDADFMVARAAGERVRVETLLWPAALTTSLAANLAVAASSGGAIVFVEPGVQLSAAGAVALGRALDAPDVVAAQPVLTSPDGLVYSAGTTLAGPRVVPCPVLNGMPRRDVEGLDPTTLAAPDPIACTFRATDVVGRRGLDPFVEGRLGYVDLTLRIRRERPGRVQLVGEAAFAPEVRNAEPLLPPEEEPGWLSTALAEFRRRWADRPDDGDVLAATLFQTARWTKVPATERWSDDFPLLAPVLVRRRPRPDWVEVDGLGRVPVLRWAVKTAAPAGPIGREWGDVHFADALAESLRRLGQDVVVDAREARYRASGDLDDVVLVLRGLDRHEPQPGQISLLWVISHPAMVSPEEMRAYDAVFVASLSWAHRLRQLDVRAEPLLQCTDPQRFRPDLGVAEGGPRVLFVGNSRNVFRPIVRDAVAAGLEPTIIGTRWEQFVDRALIRASHLPNEELAATYRSAGVVLNDHWDDMLTYDFLSNRLFDAVASGARVVSDPVAGLQEVFGGVVASYRDADELAWLVEGEGFPHLADEEHRLSASARVRTEHTFDDRARRLMGAAVAVWEQSRLPRDVSV